jgi:DNA-binding transcriptional LysR family regulator
MSARHLDLDSVQAFILVAELGSFTRAAEAIGSTQAAVSLKLKRLEDRLGCRLIERTPRRVQLSSRGATFLDLARDLAAAHERALSGFAEAPQRLTVGISDHVAGPELPALIARMNAQDPRLLIEIRIAASRELLAGFDQRQFDAVIVRSTEGRQDGEVLVEDKFGWFASAQWQHRTGEPLRLATLAEPCGVRALSTRLLDEAGIAWTETFVGGGVAAVAAAVSAGLGIAALARRMVPLGVVDAGPRLGLPPLPLSPVLLCSRVKDGRSKEALKALAAAFRGAARG